MNFIKFSKDTPDKHILLRLQLAGETMFLGYYHADKQRFISDEGIEFTYDNLIRFEASWLNPYEIEVKE